MKAFILGGTSSVAIETTKLLISDGWDITLTVRSEDKKEDLISLLGRKTKINLMLFDAQASDKYLNEIKNLVYEFDAVFCFIGYLPDESKPFNYNDIQQIIDVNFTSLIQVLDLFSNAFIDKRKGTIVGVSSVAGERGKSKNLLYASAKAGFTSYLEGLRNRVYFKNVNVLTVIPGFMDTAMTADLDLPKTLTVSAKKASSIIYSAFKKKKDIVYVTWKWRILMGIIRIIPGFIYKRLNL